MKKQTSRRALVTLPEGIWQVIDTELKGKIGDGDSEVIRNVVTSYLTERGYLLKPRHEKASTNEIASELDIHDSMITALAELLEKKGVITQNEWEKLIRRKVEV
jgi:metal-responsive CopG/Arc/MetJ family transcriptional regulator